MDLYHHNSEHIHFFVPLGVKQWFISCKIPAHQVIELDWHQESVIRIPRSFSSYRDNGYPPTHGRPSTSTEQEPLTSNFNSHFDDQEFGESNSSLTLKVICTPAQHRSGRGIFDHFKTLWGSWVVGVVNGNGDEDPFEGSVRNENGGKERFGPEDGFRMFFAGDTGFRYAGAPKAEMQQAICPAFQDIADRYGPMDLCCVPISTGSSLSFLRSIFGISLNHYALTSTQHLNSWDAIQISRLMDAKATLAIHHSTFSPEDESRGNLYEFSKTAKKENVSPDWGNQGCFTVSDIGEVLYL